MKKIFSIAICSVLLFSSFSCKKNKCEATLPSITASAAEVNYLKDYITTNNINAIQHSSGVFYEIKTPGSGASIPNLCANISFSYKGTLLSNGSTFDESTTPITYPLRQLITGWQFTLPLIKTGGSIDLYIPPSLAYGSQATGGIPANSYLKFVVGLAAVN